MKSIHCCHDTYNFRVCLYPCRVPMRGLDQTSVFTYLQPCINSCQSSFTELQTKQSTAVLIQGVSGSILTQCSPRWPKQVTTHSCPHTYNTVSQSLQNADKAVHFSPGTVFQNLFWPSAMLGEPKLSTARILTAQRQHQVLHTLQSKRNLLLPRFEVSRSTLYFLPTAHLCGTNQT